MQGVRVFRRKSIGRQFSDAIFEATCKHRQGQRAGFSGRVAILLIPQLLAPFDTLRTVALSCSIHGISLHRKSG